MQYIKMIILSFVTVFISLSSVQALSCSNSEVKDLNTTASYVKASYEVIDKSIKKEFTYNESSKVYSFPKYSFEITIYNITKDIYIIVKDDVTNKEIKVNYSNTTDGKYVITNDDFGRVYKYTITIMSALDNCYGKKIKTINLVKPKYNAYSEYTYCENSSNYYCQKFVEKDLNLKDDADFLSRIKSNSDNNAPNNNTSEDKDTMIRLFKKHKFLYLNVLISVIIVAILVIIVVNKRKNKRGWRL